MRRDLTTAYLEVAVDAPLPHALTYGPPALAAGIRLEPGLRLLVPLGKRRVTGYLLALTNQAPAATVRPILAVLDPAPLFPAALVPFFRWIADYYHHPIGEVIKTALPQGLTRQSGWRLQLTPAGRTQLAAEPPPEPLPWLAELLAKGELPPARTAQLRRGKTRHLLERWQRQGWIGLEPVLLQESIRPKTETVVIPLPDVAAPPPADFKPSEAKTLALLQELTGGSPGGIPRREILRHYPGAAKALRSLAERGVVRLAEQRLYRDPLGEPPPFFGQPARLTGEQEAVMAAIEPAIAARRYAPFLLHGVTGSGKTEIYLRAAAATLAQGRGVLVLVPEIALATQLEGHFCSRFGNEVALLHSGLSGGEKFDQWSLLQSGQARIAIGARSAIFAPLADCGLIIVDEEHDSAYKQEENLRYSSRDLALLRGRMQAATVILGSATPAVGSYFQAQAGKFTLLRMEHRVEDRPMPEVEIVNLNQVPTVSGRPPLFSPQLAVALKQNLAAGRQSLVFLNRRGFANLMYCGDCGRAIQCQHCQVSLTLHKKRGELLCHYCGYSTRQDIVCPHCRSGRLLTAGFGTERLEEELARMLPAARLARLDRDTSRNRKGFLAVLKAVRDREIDILVGTQMITKGLHFPQVTLVGIVWADAGLGMPDFKAAERTFQLLTQVTGRAGRGEIPGRVIVQTLQPDHYSVTLAQSHDYQGMYQKELALRQRLRFPPFSRLINLRLDGPNEEKVRELALALGRIAHQLADEERDQGYKVSGHRMPQVAASGTAMRTPVREPARSPQDAVSCLGPAPAPLARLKGRYRWQLLLKGEFTPLHQLCRRLLTAYQQLPGASTVKLTLDVDPENMV